MDAVNWMEHLAPRFLIKWWLHALVSPDIMGNECLANRTKNNHKLYDSLIKKQTKEKVSQWTSFQSERKQSTRVNMKLTYKIAISDSHACPSEDCLGIKMIISHPRSGSRGAKKRGQKDYSNCVYRKLPFAFFPNWFVGSNLLATLGIAIHDVAEKWEIDEHLESEFDF